MLQYVAVCCSMHQCGLECVAVCCSVLKCVSVCCSMLQCGLECVAVCCSVLQCVAAARTTTVPQHYAETPHQSKFLKSQLAAQFTRSNDCRADF